MTRRELCSITNGKRKSKASPHSEANGRIYVQRKEKKPMSWGESPGSITEEQLTTIPQTRALVERGRAAMKSTARIYFYPGGPWKRDIREGRGVPPRGRNIVEEVEKCIGSVAKGD